jgi:4-alpha-glucanotransferase
MRNRKSGILLHVTSLPSSYGIGDLGPSAYKFCDSLVEMGQTYWEILPLNSLLNSLCPYSCSSAFAGNILLISPEKLHEDGFIGKKDLKEFSQLKLKESGRVQYEKVIEIKNQICDRAFENFLKDKVAHQESFEVFCKKNSFWLEEFSLFIAIKDYLQKEDHDKNLLWQNWPNKVKNQDPKTIDNLKKRLHHEILREKFTQYLFFKQWHDLKDYCNSKGIFIIGDMPIYVSPHGHEVWGSREIFKTDRSGRPAFMGGTPPDCFSPTGQVWRVAVYDWDELKRQNYKWFKLRVAHNLDLYDYMRIDHVQGLMSYWEVPAKYAHDGSKGYWVDVPTEDLFKELYKIKPELPLIAEDLGALTYKTKNLLKEFSIPGMNVLLYAFGGNFDSPYLPHLHKKESVAFVGTHDNNTARGWFKDMATKEEIKNLREYLGVNVTLNRVHFDLIAMCMKSPANTAIIQMQDILGLGSEGHFNDPMNYVRGKGTHINWTWMMKSGQLSSNLKKKMKKLTLISGRL